MGNYSSVICCKPRTNENSSIQTTDITFTSEEIERIRKSWKNVKSKQVGINITISLIREKPRFGEYFGVNAAKVDLLDEDLQNEPLIIAQGARIEGLLDTVVCSLGQLSEPHVRTMCYRVGCIHYHRGVNFNADNWLTYKRVVLQEIVRKPKETLTWKISGKKESSTKSPNMSIISGRYSTDERSSLMSEEIMKKCSVGPDHIAWNKVLTLIIQEMKRGFLEEALKNCTA